MEFDNDELIPEEPLNEQSGSHISFGEGVETGSVGILPIDSMRLNMEETGSVGLLPIYDDVAFKGMTDYLSVFETSHLERLKHSIVSEFGNNWKPEYDELDSNFPNGSTSGWQIGSVAFKTTQSIFGDNVPEDIIEMISDVSAGLVTGKIGCVPEELKELYFTSDNCVTSTMHNAPDERWDLFNAAYTYACENPHLSIHDLLIGFDEESKLNIRSYLDEI